MQNIRISGVIKESIVDGPGIRFVIFTQGCPHMCSECHNPSTHDFDGGYLTNIDNILEVIKQNPLLSGVTFSGGEPFYQAKILSKLAKQIKNTGLNILTYTGYTFEYLINNSSEINNWKDLLEQTDILIDGPFIKEQKSLLLKFRGSSNQRIIDCKQSLKNRFVIEKEL